MSVLAEKMRRAREMRVEAGGHVFIVLRPTRLEYVQKFRGDSAVEGVFGQIVGWDKVREADLVNGGDPHPAPFDADACREWLSDRGDLFNAVAEAVVKSVEDYMRRTDDVLKN